MERWRDEDEGKQKILRSEEDDGGKPSNHYFVPFFTLKICLFFRRIS
jgi:hypothetical protein